MTIIPRIGGEIRDVSHQINSGWDDSLKTNARISI
jgi:hypothetical protein